MRIERDWELDAPAQSGGDAVTQQGERIEVTPMTAEERERMRVALEDADEIRAWLLAKNGGALFPPAAEEIAAAREERERGRS